MKKTVGIGMVCTMGSVVTVCVMKVIIRLIYVVQEVMKDLTDKIAAE